MIMCILCCCIWKLGVDFYKVGVVLFLGLMDNMLVVYEIWGVFWLLEVFYVYEWVKFVVYVLISCLFLW